jgi:hypothetical protein
MLDFNIEISRVGVGRGKRMARGLLIRVGHVKVESKWIPANL